MEESNEDLNVVPELYFLIAKFLSGGPLKETAKTLLKELQSVDVLPRRLDWEGSEHPQSFNELNSQYSEVSWRRLAAVCERALRLARSAPPRIDNTEQVLSARLSLLSESLVHGRPKYASHKQDHTLVRRLICRELGGGPRGPANGAGPVCPTGHGGPFPARLLRGLQLQRRTLGHLSAVYCLVFDSTGKYVVTGADDLLVKVWSAIDGRLLATLRGAGAEITDVSISSDGALLACGSVERLVRVWCLVTGAPRAVLHAHAGTITSVHWAPPAHSDVRWLASTSTDGSVAFWTCSVDGQFLSQPVQYVERMRPGACHMICAAWSSGGAFLACGSADHHVRIYSVCTGGPRRVLETAVHLDAVDSIAWAHRGLRFVSGSKDGTAALWTLYATQWRHSLLRTCAPDEQKKLKVTMVCWDCSDEYVMTAVSDNTVRVWCARTCTQVRSLCGHRDEAYVLEAHPFVPAVLLSAGHDGQLFVWDAAAGEVLAQFHNVIEGQGEGAIFDAKWGGGDTIAASDSHGHVLLLGLGKGHRLLAQLPTELFFHTDYRPLVRDALGGALDEQTEIPPHLMPPPFLVDVEGAPHDPQYQRLVPGRENLALSQLIPHADAARSRLDAMIEALAADPATPPAHPAPQPAGVWRGEGVRHTAGTWQPLDVPLSTRPVVLPLPPAHRDRIERASAELNSLEMAWYRREMRRRPLMISTAGGDGAARRKPGRRPRAPAPRARPQPPQPAHTEERSEADGDVDPDGDPDADDRSSDSSDSSTSDESVRLSSRSSRSSPAPTRARRARAVRARARSDSSHSPSKSDSSSSSSQYSDWEAGTALAPPARARRKPVPTTRYSPSTTAAKRAGTELPEQYRVGEWLTAVAPRKAPYHPQMGDRAVYFRLGHQRYFEAVAEKDLYKIHPRDKPWERMHINDCEAVKVVGMKYAIKPPRVVCLKLAREMERGSFTVRYHDMPDVIDFLVLRQQYDAAVARSWGQGDRFRCMIDDSWWTGIVLERVSPVCAGPESNSQPHTSNSNEWATGAASHFLSLRVQWDNGEVERLSPWDLEPLDPERLPAEPGGSVAVLPHELEAVLCRAGAHEWPPHACRAIAAHISQVMSLSVAEPFVAPVDLQLYPSYAMVVPYPVDLATIRARFENLFYRRPAAAQFDARYLASNAEQFNEPHTPIVRQARLVTDLLLSIISQQRGAVQRAAHADRSAGAARHRPAALHHQVDPRHQVASQQRGAVQRAAHADRAAGAARHRPAALHHQVDPRHQVASQQRGAVQRAAHADRAAGAARHRPAALHHQVDPRHQVASQQRGAVQRAAHADRLAGAARHRPAALHHQVDPRHQVASQQRGAVQRAAHADRAAGAARHRPAALHHQVDPRHQVASQQRGAVQRAAHADRAAGAARHRPAALHHQVDPRHQLASNAEQFNEPHTPIVRQARLVTDLLLSIISNWQSIDVVSKYHELAASYHSSDDEPLHDKKRVRSANRRRSESEAGAWRERVTALVRELAAAADAEPFRHPVEPSQAPDYLSVIPTPMDLGTVQQKLENGDYNSASEVAADVRLVFANSRLYNTNKRSRIYSMTVRLSSLFEALWSRMPIDTRSTRRSTRRDRHVRRTRRRKDTVETNGDMQHKNASSSSECETLAVASRRAARCERTRDDSWDSDAPLNAHTKGKGVGKKSKNGPVASTSSRVPPTFVATNGIDTESENEVRLAEIPDGSSSDSSAYSRIQVVEEELAEDEVEVTYEPPPTRTRRHRHDQSISRKRRRLRSSGSSGEHTAVNRPHKRTRERFTDGSLSSSSSGWQSGWRSGGRYESDRSYHPGYSTDDETPLLLYRQRQEGEVEAGPSRRPQQHRSGGVSLRKRRSPRRYNEDSEDDSIAAISKRQQRRHHPPGPSISHARSAPHTNDHNYFNGHASHHNGGSPGSGGSAGPATGPAAGPGPAGPVSISSRGRVRRLTAKARGLLRE
ncbi:PH-interacting protein [Colias croceus]|uniref:PH-interacting protein n=1 Tax=Colias crocea TaxID=72248 RepID=UPI001E27E882|nr:PH-interacting protein [Colias croceus]